MEHRLELSADLSEVARMNAWLDELAGALGLEERIAGDIKLCLNEAVTNIVSYGHTEAASGRAAVSLQVLEDRVLVTLRDNGAAFNPLEAPEPPKPERIEEARVGGLGIKIMRDTASAMSYRREGGENALALSFDL